MKPEAIQCLGRASVEDVLKEAIVASFANSEKSLTIVHSPSR